MSRRTTWIAIPFLMAGVLLVLSAGAQENQGVQASLADLLAADSMTREEMAGQYGALAGGGFEPPDCVPGDEMFDDVPASNIFCPWIEELARSGITSGCDTDNYCPGDPVSRSQMAIFIVKALEAVKPRWAVVDIDGTILRQSGGITAERIDDGFYLLDFGSPVAGHPLSATTSMLRNPVTPGSASATPCGGPGAGPDARNCATGPNRPQDVLVVTQNDAGEDSDRVFYIVAHAN